MNKFNRFLNALGAAFLWGTGAAIAGSGLVTFFWMLIPPVRLGLDDPFVAIPLFDAVLLIAVPIILFVVGAGMSFYYRWRKYQSAPCPRPYA